MKEKEKDERKRICKVEERIFLSLSLYQLNFILHSGKKYEDNLKKNSKIFNVTCRYFSRRFQQLSSLSINPFLRCSLILAGDTTYRCTRLHSRIIRHSRPCRTISILSINKRACNRKRADYLTHSWSLRHSRHSIALTKIRTCIFVKLLRRDPSYNDFHGTRINIDHTRSLAPSGRVIENDRTANVFIRHFWRAIILNWR